MRLFITGGTGFIGAHVVSMALMAGHQVLALRRNPNSRPTISLTHEPIWCEGDLHSLDINWFKDVDVVLHLASVGVSPKPASWSDLLKVNVSGSLRLFEMASDAGVRRFIVTGTSHEYGSSAYRYDAIPPDAPLQPLTPYGASKAAAFHVLRTFAVNKQLELFYGRIFSAYGEGQYEGNFWPSMCKAALAGDDFPMTLGNQISDFIPVTDVARCLIKASTRSDIVPGVPRVVNVGTGNPQSLLDFATSEWERLNATGRLLPGAIPARHDQTIRYSPSLIGL